jgi:hypothetical protein
MKLFPMVLAATATVAMLASQATALSCMQPDPAQTYKEADASADRYMVLEGTFTYDASQAPGPLDLQNQQIDRSTSATAQFEGNSLGRNGFTNPFSGRVKLDFNCGGPWCGGLQSGESYIAFALIEDNKVSVSVGPCPHHVSSSEFTPVRETLLSCAAGRRCETPVF